MSKIKVYHFYNGSGGGVWSVIKNLLTYSANPLIENHIVHAINQKLHPDYAIENVAGAQSEQLCFYNPGDNFYATCKKLAACLPDEKAIVIAHDWIELGMMSNLGLQNKVINFLHGDYAYYYELAQKHLHAIDCFICVAENIYHHLKKNIPENQLACYLRFPVPDALPSKNKIEGSIVFIGRLEEQKGFHLLEKIAAKLLANNISAKWFIVGEYKTKPTWQDGIDVEFLGNLSNNKVLELLPSMEIFMLPSLAEGMPVALIEAMKAAVVPVVNNIDGGIKELVDKEGQRGFRIDGNNIEQYVHIITRLLLNNKQRNEIQKAAKKFADEFFNPQKNTAAIEEIILQVNALPYKTKTAEKVYGSRLDQAWIPNIITKLARSR